MPRYIRLQFPGATYHVYSRGNEKKDIYLDDKDRKKFIEILCRVKKKIDFDIYAYVLMPNHYHIMLMTPDANLHKIMHLINTLYSGYFNWKYKRVGHFFQNRYDSIIVGDDAYFLELTRYIHLNPAGKKRKKDISSFVWSSLQEYLGKKAPGLSEPGKALKMFHGNKARARKMYLAFLMEGGSMTEDMIKQNMFSGIVSGTEEYRKRVYEWMAVKYKNLKIKPARAAKASQNTIIEAVAEEFNVSMSELLHKKGKANFGRKAAIYLVWKNSGLSCGEIAGLFGNTHQSNITRAVRSAEIEMAQNSDFSAKVASAEKRVIPCP